MEEPSAAIEDSDGTESDAVTSINFICLRGRLCCECELEPLSETVDSDETDASTFVADRTCQNYTSNFRQKADNSEKAQHLKGNEQY